MLLLASIIILGQKLMSNGLNKKWGLTFVNFTTESVVKKL